jgi:hypothetical protein
MNKFCVTYDIVTPESAEHADVAERGFINAGGDHVELPPDMCGKPAGDLKETCLMSLRDAVKHVSGVWDSGGDGWSYYEADGRVNYRDGSEERRALHLPDNATAATVARIARLLDK